MKLPANEIIKYARQYDFDFADTSDAVTEKELKNWFKLHRFLSKEKFIKLGLWKSKRPKKQYESNDDLTIREITEFCLQTKSEKARIECLTVLKGASYPVASVILHFACPDKYPILDFRAIWSLGLEQPKQYDFDFWQKYTSLIRKIAKQNNLKIRTVDKALWKYSKIHQK